MKNILFFAFICVLMIATGCAPHRNSHRQYRTLPPFQPAPPPPIEVDAQEITMVDIPFIKPAMQRGVVVLDAGHGGKDEGAKSLDKYKYLEKNLTMSTTLLVKGFLEQLGYKVIMTRQSDVFISLEDRAEFANIQKPNLFVSIHYNSAPSREADGVEVYYYGSGEDKMRSAKSKLLAQSVLGSIIEQTQAKSRGTKHGNFAVIRETNMTAILVEGGFLTNAQEMEKIKTPLYQKKLALGIAKGIEAFITKQNMLISENKK